MLTLLMFLVVTIMIHIMAYNNINKGWMAFALVQVFGTIVNYLVKGGGGVIIISLVFTYFGFGWIADAVIAISYLLVTSMYAERAFRKNINKYNGGRQYD